MMETLSAIARSWATLDMDSLERIKEWIRVRNQAIQVNIAKLPFDQCEGWYYDEAAGSIHNQTRSFFEITGLQSVFPNGQVVAQPVILQPEIGYLGILCKEFGGVMYFLMQAKIEPGNVNKIQISPTIQATKSNFTQKHGGARPAYLDYFLHASRYEIVVDQIQSEQSSRFYKKRNRNILIRVEEDVPVLPSHCWMTLGQIKRLMRENNLVNMDTRTVLSCIPFSKLQLPELGRLELADGFEDKPLFRSAFVGEGRNCLPEVYQYINNFKMFSEGTPRFLPLHELDDWEYRDGELVCRKPFPFKVTFCDISIEGREVRHWAQPLFEAVGIATFGLLCCEEGSVLKFVVKAAPEVGCFDGVELGPTVQREAVSMVQQEDTVIDSFFDAHLQTGEGVCFDHLLSEEGGRFYHEQNRNILLRVKREELPPLPEGYFLLDYKTLNELVQINNTLNIQLRNLLSLLEVKR